jgi:hypothetical protein
MRSRFLASVDVIEFQTTEAYSNLDLTNVKYSTYKQSKEENLKVSNNNVVLRKGAVMTWNN